MVYPACQKFIIQVNKRISDLYRVSKGKLSTINNNNKKISLPATTKITSGWQNDQIGPLGALPFQSPKSLTAFTMGTGTA